MMKTDKIDHPIRRGLDFIYRLCGGIAATFLLIMLTIIVLQMAARWSGNVFPGSTAYAGYCMAAASFFALAYALNHGAHIRVSMLLNTLGEKRRWGELWCFSIGTALAGYFSYYAIKTVYWSKILNDISQGQDATPIWIPQLSMAIGGVVLTLALADHLVSIILNNYRGLGDETSDDLHI